MRILSLLGTEDTRDASRRAGDKDTSDQRQRSQSGNSTTTAGSQTGKYTNVDTERTDVTKTGKHEVGDQNRSVRQGVGRGLDLGQVGVSDELVGNDLGGKELSDAKELGLGDTHAPAEWVEDVTEDESEGEVVDGPEVADVGEQTVDGVKERDNAEHVAEDESGNADTEPSTVGEGVERVNSISLLVELDVDGTGGDGGLGLGNNHLGSSNRGGDRHDGSSDQVSGRDTHLNVGEEDGTGNSGETRSQDLEDLGVGHEVQEALNKNSVLTLTDERRSSSDDSFGTGDTHQLEEEPSELANGPRHNAEVRKQDDKGNEEDDRGKSVDEEVVLTSEITPEEGGTTNLTLSDQVGSSESEPPGNAEEGASLEDEETDDHLKTQTGEDGLELDSRATSRDEVEEAVDDKETKKRASTVGVARLGDFLDTESTTKVDSEESEPAKTNLSVVGNLAPGVGDAVGPENLDGVGERSLGNVAVVVEENEEDEKPRPDGSDDPSVASLLTNDTGQPPAEDQADQGHVKYNAGSLVGTNGAPGLADTAGLTLRVGLDGLDGGTAIVALEVAVGSLVGELVVGNVVVGVRAVVAVGDVLLNSSVLGELRSLRGGSRSRHDSWRKLC